MQITASRAHLTVSQQPLNRVQVHTALQQVRGKAMAQRVHTARLADLRARNRALIGALHAFNIDRAAVRAVSKHPHSPPAPPYPPDPDVDPYPSHFPGHAQTNIAVLKARKTVRSRC